MTEKKIHKIVEPKSDSGQDFVEKRQQVNQVPTPPRHTPAEIQSLLGVVGPGEIPAQAQSNSTSSSDK